MADLGSDNGELRKRVEECFSDDLCYIGYDARTSYQSYDLSTFLEDDANISLTRIRNDSIDAIITIAVLDDRIEKKAMPEDLWCSPYNNYNRTFLCYERSVYSKLSRKGYYAPGRDYFWEFNFYLAQDEHLIYAARTNVMDLSKTTLVKEYCDLVISDMVWQNVIQIKRSAEK